MVTASQAVKMYELLNKYFKNTDDAKAVVVSIEEIIDEKFNNEKDRLATKHDMEQGFKDHLKWTIVLMVGMTSLLIAAIKLF